MLSKSHKLAPVARAEAVTTLLSRDSWTLALLNAMKAGDADPTTIDPAWRALLVSHKNPAITAMSRDLFGPGPASAPRLLPRLLQPSNSPETSRAGQVYEKLCSSCHKLGDRGHAVGPDMTATQFADAESLVDPCPRPESICRTQLRAIHRQRQERPDL